MYVLDKIILEMFRVPCENTSEIVNLDVSFTIVCDIFLVHRCSKRIFGNHGNPFPVKLNIL